MLKEEQSADFVRLAQNLVRHHRLILFFNYVLVRCVSAVVTVIPVWCRSGHGHALGAVEKNSGENSDHEKVGALFTYSSRCSCVSHFVAVVLYEPGGCVLQDISLPFSDHECLEFFISSPFLCRFFFCRYNRSTRYRKTIAACYPHHYVDSLPSPLPPWFFFTIIVCYYQLGPCPTVFLLM